MWAVLHMTLRLLISFGAWYTALASECPTGNCDDDTVLMQATLFTEPFWRGRWFSRCSRFSLINFCCSSKTCLEGILVLPHSICIVISILKSIIHIPIIIFHHWVFYWNVDMASWFPNLVSWESKALVSWWAIPISGYQKMHKNMEMSANSAYKVISDKTPGPVCTLHRCKSCKQIGHGNFTEWTEPVTLVEVECFC